MKSTGILLIGLCTASLAQGQTAAQQEKEAYCRYVMDNASAERSLATGLQGVGRLGQSDSDPTEKRAVVGVSKSLSKHLQGNSAVRAAQLDCQLHDRTLDLERNVRYRLAAVDRAVAEQRASALLGVLELVDEQITQTEARKRVANATAADLLLLKQRRRQIYNDQLTAKQAANQPGIPAVPVVDLTETMRTVEELTLALQGELNHKRKLEAWDLSIIAGMQRTLSGQTAGDAVGTRPFASVAFTYNLNAADYSRKLETATASLIAMRKTQNDDLFQQTAALQHTLSEEQALTHGALREVDAEVVQLKEDLASLRNIDTAEAWRVGRQIQLNLATAEMERRLLRLRAELLTHRVAAADANVSRVLPQTR